MRFSLSAYMDTATGLYNASLYNEGSLIESTTDLKSVKAVKGWARNAAEEYKKNNTPDPTESHSFSAGFHL